jgi:hypothetical protein
MFAGASKVCSRPGAGIPLAAGHANAHPFPELRVDLPARRRADGRAQPGSLVLVDTGFGLRDVADPRGRLSKFFLFLLSPEFRDAHTAIRQVERLGYDPRDVRAAVHLLAAEKSYVMESFSARTTASSSSVARRPAPERRATPLKEIPWRNRTWQARSS